MAIPARTATSFADAFRRRASRDHTSVSVVLDRYGHLLPGAEERVTDALDAMARAAASPREARIAALR